MMITNLFSIFDPCTSDYLSLNWLIMFIPFIIFSLDYWVIPSFYCYFQFKFMNMLLMEFLNLMFKFKINLIIFITLVIYLLIINLISLMPYVFTLTSHMSINLSLSLTLWVSFILYGWLNFSEDMFIHLVPMNTPEFLMNFMVLIETVSNIIRPWTLSIRLSANMLAGHLLLLLLSSSCSKFILILPFILMIQLILLILEIFVSFIQSYVFSVLSLLYFNESNF